MFLFEYSEKAHLRIYLLPVCLHMVKLMQKNLLSKKNGLQSASLLLVSLKWPSRDFAFVPNKKNLFLRKISLNTVSLMHIFQKFRIPSFSRGFMKCCIKYDELKHFLKHPHLKDRPPGWPSLSAVSPSLWGRWGWPPAPWSCRPPSAASHTWPWETRSHWLPAWERRSHWLFSWGQCWMCPAVAAGLHFHHSADQVS